MLVVGKNGSVVYRGAPHEVRHAPNLKSKSEFQTLTQAPPGRLNLRSLWRSALLNDGPIRVEILCSDGSIDETGPEQLQLHKRRCEQLIQPSERRSQHCMPSFLVFPGRISVSSTYKLGPNHESVRIPACVPSRSQVYYPWRISLSLSPVLSIPLGPPRSR